LTRYCSYNNALLTKTDQFKDEHGLLHTGNVVHTCKSPWVENEKIFASYKIELQSQSRTHKKMSLFAWDYSPLSKQQVAEIIEKAITNGSCIRCALSIVQCFESHLYQIPSKRITHFLNEGQLLSNQLYESYSDDKNTCVVCRGLFQDDVLFQQIPQRVAEIAKQFTFQSFGTSVVLHHAFFIRDHLMTVYARDGIYQWDGKGEVIQNTDRKRIFKEVTGTILGKRLNELLQPSNYKIVNIQSTAKSIPQINIEIKTSEPGENNEDNDSNIQQPAKKKSRYEGRKEHQNVLKANEVLGSVLKEKSLQQLGKQYTCPPVIPSTDTSTNLLNLDIVVYHSPIYFSGRYLKLQRGLPQSPWLIRDDPEATNAMQGSLEEYIGKVFKKYTNAETWKFDSAGREDIDVRMLGKGRPFVFTIIKPAVTIFDQTLIEEIQSTINNQYEDIVQVNSLKVTHDTEISKQMREGAVEKKKQYRCVIWYKGIIEDDRIKYMESLVDLKIAQNTPVRVLHRRSAQIREKVIHELKCVEKLNDHYMILDLTTSAGTYVKEFIHSDFGRTVPSLGTILAGDREGLSVYQDAHILQLDVMDIEMEQGIEE
jgi:tRNA pseudouridine synthase 10